MNPIFGTEIFVSINITKLKISVSSFLNTGRYKKHKYVKIVNTIQYSLNS